MRRAVTTSYRTSVTGEPIGQVRTVWQYAFHAKKAHGFRNALGMALARQRGRSVP
jgi:hypothetical protein